MASCERASSAGTVIAPLTPRVFMLPPKNEKRETVGLAFGLVNITSIPAYAPPTASLLEEP
jgi:hypothetical protein